MNVVNKQDGRDIEILECGLIKQDVLKLSGLDPDVYSGWALGMGLDRLVMTLKDVPDIRYLRSNNPKIASQMSDLDPYQEVSRMPAIQRDMSYSVPESYVEEDISQDIIDAMGDGVGSLEEVEVVSEVDYVDLPVRIREKLGIQPGQKNVLVRITLRDLEQTLTDRQANTIYDLVYQQVNHGSAGY